MLFGRGDLIRLKRYANDLMVRYICDRHRDALGKIIDIKEHPVTGITFYIVKFNCYRVNRMYMVSVVDRCFERVDGDKSVCIYY